MLAPRDFVVMSINAARANFVQGKADDAVKRLTGGLTVNPQTCKYVADRKVFAALVAIAQSNVDIQVVVDNLLFPELETAPATADAPSQAAA